MLKRHEIEILLKAGHPKTEVARLAGVSARSVHRFAEEHPVVDVNDSAERAQRHILRPSIVEDFRKLVLDSLKEKADLCSLLRPAGERFTHLYMDFAAGLQNTLQEKVHILYHFAGETKLRNLCLAGDITVHLTVESWNPIVRTRLRTTCSARCRRCN